MGRKIPGRKHRGVRDPEKQRQQRFLSIKDKINAPPANPDNQEIPKSLTEIIQLKEKAKTIVKKKSQGKTSTTNKFRPIMKLTNGTIYNFNSPKVFFDPNEKPAPIFMQENGESDKQFLYRVNKVCESVIKETEFERKYSVTVHRNRETGQVVKVTKSPNDEIEKYLKKVRKESNKSKKKTKDKTTNEPKLTKSQKRRKKLLEKKQKKQLNETLSDKLNVKDNVKFGEVAHGPPVLVTPRKVEGSGCAPRPGAKDLLLKSILQKQNNVVTEKTKKKIDPLRKTLNNKINKKGKRKELPLGVRRQLDKQQQEMINAYRELKKQKLKR